MKVKPTFRGMTLYSFRGVPHLARKDIRKCHEQCVKQTNGRYYMPLTKYVWGRRSYWISLFRMTAWQIIHIARRKRDSLRLAVEDRVLKRRRMALLKTLKSAELEYLILSSSLYQSARRKIRERRTCRQCGSLQTEFKDGPCECHLCEDWFGCSGGRRKIPTDLVCSQCGYSQRVSWT